MGLSVILMFLVLQPNSGIDLRWHWMSSFVLVYLLVLTAGRLTKFSNAALATVLLAFGLVNLWSLWFSGISDYILLGGLLPFSDAGGYFSDAQNILLGNAVSDFSGKRPIYAATLSTITAVFGNNLHHILVAQTVIVGSAIAFLAVRCKQNYGVVFTAFFIATIWLFYRRFIGETMTENLGLLFGCLGLCFLWQVCQNEKSKYTLYLGLFFLSIGLVSRAGPFFVLPALAIWAGVIFAEQPKKFNFSAFGVCILAILSGFVINKLLMHGLNIQSTLFSNFAQTLYGLLAGGDWKMAREVNPAILNMGLEEEARETYRMAWELFVNDPTSLIKGAARAIAGLGMTMYLFGYSFHPTAPALIPTVVLTLLALVGLCIVVANRGDPKSSMLLAVLIGCFASAPFVPPWDADMMRAYAVVIPFLSLIPAVGFVYMIGAKPASTATSQNETARASRNDWYLGSALLGLSVMSCLILPVALKGKGAEKLAFANGSSACAKGEVATDIILFPAAQLYLTADDQVFDLRQFGKKVLKQPAKIFDTNDLFPAKHTFSHRQFLEKAYRENVSVDIREKIASMAGYKMLSYAYYRERGQKDVHFSSVLFAKTRLDETGSNACIKKLQNWPYVAVTN